MLPREKWSVPLGAWKGETAFILGGGPSLKGFDAECLRGKGRIIAVNDAGLHLAPWADVLFWADRRWLDWNHDKLGLHTGAWKVTRSWPHLPLPHKVHWLDFKPKILSTSPTALGGICGGSSALNLAFLLGADPIVLLGFDMRPGNWHSNHRKPPAPGQHANKFIPTLTAMAPEIAAHGVRVLNATPGSALECFPMVDIEAVLA